MKTARMAALAAAGMLLGSMASASWAGEITGNGKSITLHGTSWCRYSGLDDSAAVDPFERTQNYGQLVALYDFFDPKDFNPNTSSYLTGEGCNPTKAEPVPGSSATPPAP